MGLDSWRDLRLGFWLESPLTATTTTKAVAFFSKIFNFPFEPPFCLAKAALQFGAFVGQVKGNTHSANMDTQHTHTHKHAERERGGRRGRVCATLFTAFFFPLFALQFSICCLCCFPPRPARFVYVVQGALVACLDVVVVVIVVAAGSCTPYDKARAT